MPNHEAMPLLHDQKARNDEQISRSKRCIITLMGALMLIYSIAEIGAALWLHSLSMFSDGLHNLSDAASLAIAYWAEQAKSRDRSESMTFGWRRAELLGGLSNGLFLLAISTMILLQAVPKFVFPEDIDKTSGLYFMIVAGAGMVLNVIGMVGLGGHGHSHAGGSHGHSHASTHGHSHDHHGHSHGHNDDHNDDHQDHGHGHDNHRHGHDNHDTHDSDQAHIDHNMWGLFLHFAGDVVTSLLVLLVGLFMYLYPTQEWVRYADPAASVLSVLIIFLSAWPLVKSCAIILLQGSPTHIDQDKLRQLVFKVTGVMEMHELHLWQLVDGIVICTLHLKVQAGHDDHKIRGQVTEVLHQFGIHSPTIQIEYVEDSRTMTVGSCTEYGNCVPECEADTCCPPNKLTRRSISSINASDHSLI
eukprot:TRINITY_DN7179_c0_g1_i3.p1 TRINITY_DN7179_c0_g1~~TRINITY_DN7179_c0_g1_i3.p1  ORF type:complete len:416 (+),score=64.89 TRINITY_DN7179_c0_g1_i3:219-1466(+)